MFRTEYIYRTSKNYFLINVYGAFQKYIFETKFRKYIEEIQIFLIGIMSISNRNDYFK